MQHLILMFVIGLIGVFAHILSKVLGAGDHSVNALSVYWKTKGLSIVLAIVLYVGLFAAWQTSDILNTLGFVKGQISGAIFFVGYFSQSIVGHLAKSAPYNESATP